MAAFISQTDVSQSQLIRDDLWRAQMKISRAEVFSTYYLINHVVAFRQNFELEFSEALKQMNAAKSMLKVRLYNVRLAAQLRWQTRLRRCFSKVYRLIAITFF